LATTDRSSKIIILTTQKNTITTSLLISNSVAQLPLN